MLLAVENDQLGYARKPVNMIRQRAKRTAPIMSNCMSYANLLSSPVVDWNQPATNYIVETYSEGHPAFSSKEESRKAVRDKIRLEFATEGYLFFYLRVMGFIEKTLNGYVKLE